MKVPANLSGDGLIQEYLSRVTAAGARYLPEGSRTAFVGSTRSRIEREIGPDGASDLARVRTVLARLGDPEDLARAACARLRAEPIGGRSAGGDGGAGAFTTPLEYRPVRPQRKPVEPARPRWPFPAGESGAPRRNPPDETGERPRRGRLGGLLQDRPDGPPAPPRRQEEAQAPAGPPGLRPWRPAQWAAGGTGTQAARGISARAPGGGGHGPAQLPAAAGAAPASADDRPVGSIAPIGPVTPVDGTPLPPRAPLTLRGVAIPLCRSAAGLAVSGAKLARRYPLESAAVVLLGVGGLIYPYPFWLLAALLTIWSRVWNGRDKWVAVAGPPAIAVAGMLLTALRLHGGMIGNIPHAFRLDFSYMFRLGCLLCAVYLALQARHGPQRRLAPWQR